MQNYAEENIALHEQINDLKLEIAQIQEQHGNAMSDSKKEIAALQKRNEELESIVSGKSDDWIRKQGEEYQQILQSCMLKRT